jgi:hypothetical protein
VPFGWVASQNPRIESPHMHSCPIHYHLSWFATS